MIKEKNSKIALYDNYSEAFFIERLNRFVM